MTVSVWTPSTGRRGSAFRWAPSGRGAARWLAAGRSRARKKPLSEPILPRMRSRSAVLAAIFVAGFAFTVSADTYPRQPAVDAVHYRFEFSVTNDSPRIEGETTATLRIVAPTNEVQFDLKGESAGKGMAVSNVTVDGQSATFDHRADRLRV